MFYIYSKAVTVRASCQNSKLLEISKPVNVIFWVEERAFKAYNQTILFVNALRLYCIIDGIDVVILLWCYRFKLMFSLITAERYTRSLKANVWKLFIFLEVSRAKNAYL